MERTHPWPKEIDGVLLRDPTGADIPLIERFRNLPEVNRWLIVTPETREALERRWNGVISSDTDFSCVAELGGEVAGIGYLEIGDGMGQPGMPRGTEASIGYTVHPDLTGRGVGSAIGRALVEAAFLDLGIRRVTAGCFADNRASVRILEKAGLRKEQHGRGDSWHADLGWIDGCTYGALTDEWSGGERRRDSRRTGRPDLDRGAHDSAS